MRERENERSFYPLVHSPDDRAKARKGSVGSSGPPMCIQGPMLLGLPLLLSQIR